MKRKLTLDDLTLVESTHRYFLSGKELTSVTHALEAAGVTDFSKVPWEQLERARLLGDYAHQIAMLYARQDLDESSLNPALSGYLTAIKDFFHTRVSRVLLVEFKVYDLTMGYAGTGDVVYEDHRGRVCLDDYKKSQAIHPAARLQTAAYKRPIKKLYKIDVHERGGVRISDDGTWKRTPYTDQSDFPNFVHALELGRWKMKHGLAPAS